ncbi:ATP-dependent DNA helicase RecG, partial [Candidatus Microgenomates bacterium]
MDWHTPIRYVPLVGPVYEKKLLKLEIETVADLLWHKPLRFDDYSRMPKLNSISDGETVTLIGQVISAKNVYTRSRKQIQYVTVTDETGIAEAVWFNQPFIITGLRPGMQVALAGKAQREAREVSFKGPQYEIIRSNKPLLHTGRLVPIYAQTAGVSSKWLRSRIASLLENKELLAEYLPSQLIRAESLTSIAETLQSFHFPKNLDDFEIAKTRLVFEELFLLQLNAGMRRNEWQTAKRRQSFVIAKTAQQEFNQNVPFVLTNSQQKVTAEIINDLTLPTPMNRLLQGDVGSGKTVVAAFVTYLTFLNKQQTLFMAPTEILAEQHFKTLTQLLTPLGVSVGLQTGAHKAIVKGRKKTPKKYDVLVGTHALIENTVALEHIGLVVIDEQHRFGVKQRALLRQKGEVPHVLTMTATPIPRTIALTFHGDLDLSTIDELPQGRKPIKTWVVPEQKRADAYTWIEKEITKTNPHAQAFIVVPFIEPSETLATVKAATKEFENLQKKVFPNLKLGLIHGKLKASDKQKILDGFREGTYDILVATPVVEVGIDIPRASIMVIEEADRFGLAQLHQLRGRVGRNDQQAYCLLFSKSRSPQTRKRLKHLETTTQGAKLAELDLSLRGAGAIFGTKQHGAQE